jgi:hypothetical protein
MSLRAKIVGSIAVAASAFLLAPAGAQAATHPVQVSGAKLKSALLPASTFGSGFKQAGAISSGKSLWSAKAKKHVPAMSCSGFENAGLTRFGETAAAFSASVDNDGTSSPDLSNLTILYEQSVYQFPSTRTGATFYSQVHAKYAACKSFDDKVLDGSGQHSTVTLKSIAWTRVGKYHAFQLTQSLGNLGLPGISLNLNTLVTVAGADVFIVTDFSTSNHPVSAKSMLKLVSRVKALR